MGEDFERRLRDHLHQEAEQTRELPYRLRGRIRDGIGRRARAGPAPQLALAGALVLVAVAVLTARNPTIITAVPSTIREILAPTPTPQPFRCSDRSGGTAGLPVQLTAIRVASHEEDGYDRIVFDFSGGIPSFDLNRQDSPTFVRDASGQPVTLAGAAGIRLVFRDTDLAPGVAADAKPGLKAVREIAQVGNLERVASYGIGIASSECVRVLELSGPSRLVIDVATPAAASRAPAPSGLS